MATTLEPVALPKVRHTECFIDGKWVPAASGKTFATMNPATEEEIAQVAEGDAADIERAVKAARKAFENSSWSRMDARDRGRLIYRLADLIEEEIDELAALEALDNGKPVRDARAADLPLVVDCLRYYAGFADKIQGATIPVRGNYFTYTRKEPVGVVGQIIPWNFPMLMVAWKWGPALAAGCTIVMKPAEQTPLTCLRMAQLAKEAGFPDGVINVVPGFGPTAGAALVKHPGVDKIAFTGEHRTAQIIMRDASESLKRLTFELGGKSPNVILADADLDAAAAGTHFGLFFNQGQCCCGPVDEFDRRADDLREGRSLDCLVPLPAPADEGVFLLAEDFLLVAAREHPEGVAGLRHQGRTEDEVALFQLDAAESLPRAGEDRDFVHREVDDDTLLAREENGTGVATEFDRHDGVLLDEFAELAAGFR